MLRARLREHVMAGRPATGVLVLLEADDQATHGVMRGGADGSGLPAEVDAVLEATSDGVLVLADDPSRFVLMTNEAFAGMLGLVFSIVVHEFAQAIEIRIGVALHADLRRQLVLVLQVGGADHAGFFHRIGQRLFAVHVHVAV